ncbi:MAG: anaerobic ribonucleoside-triphosphate reductase activating protein [Duncaniella sp.]|uniref:anaerobic ribonucleoside-triphosphate reductase activating protein n=1 Tax=Duncaniella sp. TaxID=2518496 RepID=UPI0023BC0130|nr:anaerobic ribonucleoside-triphosphate reductase activating protein [Duncaniella sp.]MDE5988445.1 anaerobic ribonucleoside-triphosphate reductase activating protein [Duncaniella sp.]
MKILDIVPGTSVDGPGLRTAIYVAGCSHSCPGCHNPQSWDFDGGREMSVDEIMREVIDNDFDVTLTGGDPMYRAAELLPLAARIKEAGKGIWCYTGFRYEDVMRSEPMRRLLEYIDVLVDGAFVEAQRDVHLLFRGSANQRLVDVGRSTPGNVVEWSW